MTTELEAKLRAIGWFPNRCVADVQVAEWLRVGVQDFGCHIFPKVITVLKEYGDLVFGDLHFSPEESLMRGEKLEWLHWEWQVNEILFPIAYELEGTFTFALSSTGKVYGNGVSSVFCGGSFEEFLNNQFISQKGAFPWIEVIPMQWTPEKEAELEWICEAVYVNEKTE